MDNLDLENNTNSISQMVRNKSDPVIFTNQMLRNFMANFQQVIFASKLSLLFLAVPLALVANFQGFARPLLFKMALEGGDSSIATSTLQLSRASSIFMLLAYVAYIYFQLKTHGKLFDAQEEDEDEEKPVIGFWSAFIWLVGMTLVISVLSEYVVGTIEDASDSWGISVGFISIILLPIVGNAAEHAGSVIFAFKNKLDMSLGIAMGSATQISMFVVPLSVVVAWIMDIQMDLDFNLLETGCLAFTIIVTAFTLQDGTSHYMKGVVLSLCYIVMAACFFVHKTPLDGKD
ncbi:hypothetical protein TanjilG_32555 [Lupinus angustifolius]|uniref:Sodium/calcium exchanger membrane region domain-containing protein n=1 Tax=Lupinus angustifolius TaxID=3871 RepID=A0A4P1R8I3_LUPAN|nr:hypothetical protein TanjilG_32555 [Lupinus angustifolius]